jgi:hypothetical protein
VAKHLRPALDNVVRIATAVERLYHGCHREEDYRGGPVGTRRDRPHSPTGWFTSR